MKKNIYACLMSSIFFACISHIVCSFFFNPLLSVLLGLFTGVIYFLVFIILTNINSKKQARILSEYGDNFLFNENVNYYDDNKMFNGLLVLAESTLFFIATEKKRFKFDYNLQEISEIEYSKIFRHIQGLRITMKDGSLGRFSMSLRDYENLNEKINLSRSL